MYKWSIRWINNYVNVFHFSIMGVSQAVRAMNMNVHAYIRMYM